MGEHVTMSGPIFSNPHAVIDHMCADIRHAVGEDALSEVQTNLDASIKHPTPYYETQVNSADRHEDTVVNDRGVVYGPWLEGVGSRNQTTSFKGYSSFRRAFQTVRGRVMEDIRPYVGEAVRKLGGRA
jgi:hypothetical protein